MLSLYNLAKLCWYPAKLCSVDREHGRVEFLAVRLVATANLTLLSSEEGKDARPISVGVGEEGQLHVRRRRGLQQKC